MKNRDKPADAETIINQARRGGRLTARPMSNGPHKSRSMSVQVQLGKDEIHKYLSTKPA